MSGFVCVDIAHSCDDSTIEEKVPHGPATSARLSVQVVSIETILERFRPQAGEEIVPTRISSSPQHRPESARVPKPEHAAIGEDDVDVVVRMNGIVMPGELS